MLRAMLNVALYGKPRMATAMTGHWAQRVRVQAPTGYHQSHKFYSGERGVVYVYRDGRDVLASLYRTKGFLHPTWVDLSFSEFLRRPLDWHGTPGKRAAVKLTPGQHWKKHLDSWENRSGTFYVRYEDLLIDAQAQIERIAARFNLNIVAEVGDIAPVGPFPSGDHRLEKWREVFSEDDLTLFFEIVPSDYWGLWQCS